MPVTVTWSEQALIRWFRLPALRWATLMPLPRPAPPAGVANSPFQFYVSQAGIYLFRVMYYQTAGSANLEWFELNADGTRTLINDAVKADAIPAYYQWTAPAPPPTLNVAPAARGRPSPFTDQ